MRDFDSRYIIEGTSALKFGSAGAKGRSASIIPFPEARQIRHRGAHARTIEVAASPEPKHSASAGFLQRARARSVFFGSISKESLAGQPFGQLKKWETVAFFVLFTAIACSSVYFGA